MIPRTRPKLTASPAARAIAAHRRGLVDQAARLDPFAGHPAGLAGHAPDRTAADPDTRPRAAKVQAQIGSDR